MPPERSETAAVLLEVARRAAANAHTCTHPVDIASAIVTAVEYAAETLDIIHKRKASQ